MRPDIGRQNTGRRLERNRPKPAGIIIKQGLKLLADNQRALRAHPVGIAVEGLPDPVQRAEIIQMLRFDIGNDVNFGMKMQEAVHIFASLDDHIGRVADPEVFTQILQNSADGNGRILAGLHIDIRNHTAGAGFAMGAGHGDRHAEFVKQIAQQHGPFNDPCLAGPSRDQLRIILLDGSRINNGIHVRRNIAGPLADDDRNAEMAQMLCNIGFPYIRAGNVVAAGLKDLRQTAHADAPDSDKVNIFHNALRSILLMMLRPYWKRLDLVCHYITYNMKYKKKMSLSH